MKLKNIENIEMIFIKRVKFPLYFIYEVMLVNNSDKNAKYDMHLLLCNSGQNVLFKNINNIDDMQLLISGSLKKGENIKGYIAFEKNDYITNQPSFFWGNNKLNKLKDRDMKGEL